MTGGHALRHGEQEAWPQQGGSMRHSTGHVCKAKNALTGSRSCAFACRGTRAHFRAVFVVLAVLAVAFGSTTSMIESNPARLGPWGGSRAFLRGGQQMENETLSRHLSHSQDSVHDRRRIQDAARNTQDAENTRDTLHGLLLAPLTVAGGTVPIPRRRRRDLPQLWRRQRRDEVRPGNVCMAPMMRNPRTISTSTAQTLFRV